MIDKLLPCPFCEGDARLALGEHDFDGAEVFCKICIASCGHFSDDPKGEAATKGWNTRAPAQPAQSVPEGWWQVIHDTLRNYSMTTLVDEEGYGYPLIDAMTADGQTVSGGIEECTYLADAIWNALIAAAPSAPAAQGGE